MVWGFDWVYLMFDLGMGWVWLGNTGSIIGPGYVKVVLGFGLYWA